jgi:hypothetical protein
MPKRASGAAVAARPAPEPPAHSMDTWGRSFPEPPPAAYVVGIDPGDVHCGMAVVRTSYDDATREGRVEVARAEEFDPDSCADHLAAWLLEGWVDAVAVERFSLYGDKVGAQVGSQMQTAQLIGVLRYVTRLANRGRRDVGRPEVTFALQGADIKKGIRAQARARDIPLIPASADHARDAQLHGIYFAGRHVLGWGL